MNITGHMRLATLVLGIVGASVALAQPKVLNGIFTDDKGMSLYWWDNDVPGSGKAVCTGACALSWPPLVAELGATPAGDFTLAERDDGIRQWAYKGRPLYRWVNDTRPGDTTGDGFRKGLWHLAKP